MEWPPTALTAAELADLIEREHERVELKTGLGRRPLQATLVAMTNTEGGLIVVGMDDDRNVIGRRRDQGVDDDIHGAAFDATNVGRIEIAEVLVDGIPVVFISVGARLDDVAQTSDGRVLVRQGGHNRALSAREISQLYLRRSRIRFETTDSGVNVDEVDPSLAAGVARAFGWSDASDHDRWLERGLLGPSGTLSVAGALVLTDPGDSLHTAKFRIDVRSYPTDTSTSYTNRKVIGGPVQTQVPEATDLVITLVGTEMIFTGARRHDVPRLPRRVVREAIANAVGHRTYEQDASPIVIEVRQSAVKIISPGGLIEPVTIDTLRQAQAARNHIVIDVLRRFGFAEDSGQGIDVIQDEMRLELLQEPAFVDRGDHFEVELPLSGLMSITERGWMAEFEDRGLIRREDRALLLIASREGRITNRRIRDELGIDSTAVRARVAKLRDAGLLVQHGTRSRAYYTLGTVGPARSNEQLVVAAAEQGRVTNHRVREITGLDRLAALALLRRLLADGQLVQHGARRATFYTRPDAD